MLKKKRFDEISTMQAKQQHTLVMFSTTHFTMFRSYCQWPCSIKYQADYCEGENNDYRVNDVVTIK